MVLLCSVFVVPVEAEEKTVTGTFFFDVGDWNYNDNICFYIWAKNADGEIRHLYNGGWQNDENWGSKKLFGTYVAGSDGIFESYNIEFWDGWDYFVIFNDYDTGAQTYDCVFTKDAIGKTAYMTGNTVENPIDSAKTCIEIDFENVPGSGTRLQITSTGNIIGHTKASNDDSAKTIANYIFNKMWQSDKSGEECCTKEKVSKAISAYHTTPTAVWEQFQKIEGSEAKEYGAKKLIFSNVNIGDIDGDSKVTAKDSMAIQRHVINSKKLDNNQLKAADIDGDGKVSNKDAIIILRYSINIKVNYPIGELV